MVAIFPGKMSLKRAMKLKFTWTTDSKLTV